MSRAESKVATRARVLEAAHALFLERGFIDVGVREIARAAGVSTGSVFASFTDKAALYRALTGLDPDHVLRCILIADAELRRDGAGLARVTAHGAQGLWEFGEDGARQGRGVLYATRPENGLPNDIATTLRWSLDDACNLRLAAVAANLLRAMFRMSAR